MTAQTSESALTEGMALSSLAVAAGTAMKRQMKRNRIHVPT